MRQISYRKVNVERFDVFDHPPEPAGAPPVRKSGRSTEIYRTGSVRHCDPKL
jgi:hypothetical protein